MTHCDRITIFIAQLATVTPTRDVNVSSTNFVFQRIWRLGFRVLLDTSVSSLTLWCHRRVPWGPFKSKALLFDKEFCFVIDQWMKVAAYGPPVKQSKSGRSNTKKKSKKWPMTSPHHSPVRWKNFGFQRIPLLAHGNPLRSSCLFQHLTLHSTMGRSNVLWDTLKTTCDTDVHSVRQPGGNWRCWCPVPSLLLPQPAQDAPRAGAEHSALRRPSNGSADTLIAFIFQRGQQQRPPDKILWTKIIFTFFFFSRDQNWNLFI